MDRERLTELLSIFKKMLPALSFFAGFMWDSITLGGRVDSSDLWILGGYYALLTGVVWVLSFDFDWKYRDKIPFLFQFLNGSLFSALVVFYFKSTHTIGASLMVVLLFGLLIANEFWHHNYLKREFTWGIYSLCAIMFLNFIIPHVVGSISVFWFITSLFLGILPVVLIWKRQNLGMGALKIPIIILAGVVILYGCAFIPPVPLVIKDQVVCQDFKRTNEGYTCAVEPPGMFEVAGVSDPELQVKKGEKIWCLTSVFAPVDLEVSLEHRWHYYDSSAGQWAEVDIIPFSMKGGRENGWRFYSSKKNWQPGWWMVEIAIQNGRVIGFTKFRIAETENISIERRKYLLM